MSVAEFHSQIDSVLRARGGAYKQYSCKTVSWDDVQRGEVDGNLSCWGDNITDTRLYAKDGRQLFTVRPENWNEKLGWVDANDVDIIVQDSVTQDNDDLNGNPNLASFLKEISKYGKYAGVKAGNIGLNNALIDNKVSIRFQTTFLPVEEPNPETAAPDEFAKLEFATEAYSYATRDNKDPRNLVLLCTSQGVAVQADQTGKQKLFHHRVEDSDYGRANVLIHRHWLEAERSKHKVGGQQVETEEEKQEAKSRGKATAERLGPKALGTRFNALLTVQVPLEQKEKERIRYSGAVFGASKKKSGLKMPNLFAAKGMKVQKCAAPMMASNMEMKMQMACDDLLDMSTEYNSYQDAACEEEGAFEFDEDDSDMEGLEEEGGKKCKKSCIESDSDEEDDEEERGEISAPKSEKKVGTANAARVSVGTEQDTWGGLKEQLKEERELKRHSSEHVTITVIFYYTVIGGVPAEEDVIRAIDDLELMYAACDGSGKLGEAAFNFMKSEL